LVEVCCFVATEGVEHAGLEGHSLLQGFFLLGTEGAHDLQDGEELLSLSAADKDGLEECKFGHDAADGPDIYGHWVPGGSHDEFRRAVVPRHDIGSVFAFGVDDLAASKIAYFYLVFIVEKDVFGFEIAMCYILLMDMDQSVQQLMHDVLR
jgi:hypothetical protein